MLTLLDGCDQSLSPKGWSSRTLKQILAHVSYFLSTSLFLSYLVLIYPYCNYLHVRAQDIFKCPSLDISNVPCSLPSLSSYRFPEDYPCVSCLTPDTTKPINSSCYRSYLPQWPTLFSKNLTSYYKKLDIIKYQICGPLNDDKKKKK